MLFDDYGNVTDDVQRFVDTLDNVIFSRFAYWKNI